MLSTTTRPLTSDERFNISQRIRGMREVHGGCIYYFIQLAGGLVLGMLASAIPAAILQWLGASTAVCQAAIIVGTAGGFLLGVWSVLKDRWRHVRPYELALRENLIEEVNCTVLDAMRVSLGEDQGFSYFLDVGDSKLLYLEEWRFFEDFEDDVLDELIEDELIEEDGDAVDEPDDEPRLPRRALRLTRTPHGRHLLTAHWQGEHFEPSREREPLDGRVEYVPDDGEIINGSIATLEADLRRLRRR